MSNKLAANDYPILEVLRRRWSPRAFSNRPLDELTLRTLFEAARWSQSSFNEQPWRFVVAVATDTTWHEQLGTCLAASNGWAKQAPVLGLSVAKTSFSHNNSPNRVAVYDVGAAMMSLTIQATEMGLYVHQMAGFDLSLAREVARIPEGFEPIAMFALGHLGDPESLTPDQRARELAPRTRKPLSEIVFAGPWNHASI